MQTKTLCLAVLKRSEASGYEIKKALEEPPFGAFQEASFGSIYPALAKMSEEGLVTVREEEQSGKPDKKVYAITEKGADFLLSELLAPPPPDKLKSDFLFQLFHADLLPEPFLLRILDEQIARYSQRIEMMETCIEEARAESRGRGMAHGFGLTLYRAARDYLQARRAEIANEGLAQDGDGPDGSKILVAE